MARWPIPGMPAAEPRPEHRALLLAARTGQPAEAIKELRALLATPGFDWKLLAELAVKHRVTPLAWNTLKALPKGDVPQPIADEFTVRTRHAAHRTLAIIAELARLTHRLEAAKISTVAYKGVVLGELAYGSATLRQPGDLDLLVSAAKAPAAVRELAADGYVPKGGKESVLRDPDFWTHGREATFVGPSRLAEHVRFEVEIKCSTHDPKDLFGISGEEILTTGGPVSVGGRPIPAPRLDLHFLVLCFHGDRHTWHRLAWITDIAELLRRDRRMDWKSVWDRATTMGSRRHVEVALLLARRMLDASIPDALCDIVGRDSEAMELVATVERGIFAGMEELPRTAYYEYRRRARERWLDRVKFRWGFRKEWQ